jgi:hypothetical protein
MHGHGEKPFICTYEGCERGVAGNGFPRHWNLTDHLKRVHNDTGQRNSTYVSPPPGSPKGGKRKAEDNTPNREKSMRWSVTSPELSLVERYQEKQRLLLETVTKLEGPKYPETMGLLHNAQEHIKEMVQVAQRINSAPER